MTCNRPEHVSAPAIGIAGAGAIGITLAARMQMSGNKVTLLTRDTRTSSFRQDGIRLIDHEGQHHLHPEVASTFDAGHFDVLFLCAKSHDLPGLAVSIQHLISNRTVVVPVVNGIPWWYFEGQGGSEGGRRIFAADPDGSLGKAIPWRQVIGTTTVITAEKTGRTSVVSSNPLQMTIGELTDEMTLRVTNIRAILEGAGISIRVAPRIRDAVWTKVARNLISNPLTAVTGATLDLNFADPHLGEISKAMLAEMLPVIDAYGASLEVPPEEILALGQKMGPIKTSMLQDLQLGRRLELATICDAVIELAEARKIEMPVVAAISRIAHFIDRRNGEAAVSEANATNDDLEWSQRTVDRRA